MTPRSRHGATRAEGCKAGDVLNKEIDMNLKRRLASLERRANVKSDCATCGGDGWPGYVLVSPSGKIGVPFNTCPECNTLAGGLASCKSFGTDTEDVNTLPDWMAAV